MIANIKNPWLRRSLVIVCAVPVGLVVVICAAAVVVIDETRDLAKNIAYAWKGSN